LALLDIHERAFQNHEVGDKCMGLVCIDYRSPIFDGLIGNIESLHLGEKTRVENLLEIGRKLDSVGFGEMFYFDGFELGL
jgi:hypothetical protein